jgi:hypothetical protein
MNETQLPKTVCYAGLDLGQAQDYTALAILERPLILPTTPMQDRVRSYAVRHLERFPLGTSYPEIVRRVTQIVRRPALAGGALAVDATGVGRPVIDLFTAKGVRLNAINITSGHAVTKADDGSWHVPKKVLVSTVQILLQSRRLRIAECLPDAVILAKEMQAFRVKITTSGNETFEAWRERDHDDLVLAVALAAWLGERIVQRTPSPQEYGEMQGGVSDYWSR